MYLSKNSEFMWLAFLHSEKICVGVKECSFSFMFKKHKENCSFGGMVLVGNRIYKESTPQILILSKLPRMTRGWFNCAPKLWVCKADMYARRLQRDEWRFTYKTF